MRLTPLMSAICGALLGVSTASIFLYIMTEVVKRYA